MSTRKNISSGAKWEDIIGYSRAVRVGNIIEVSGTTAMKEGVLQGQGDIYVQTKTCIQIIQAALEQAGASISIKISASINAATSIMLVAGLIVLKNSPCALPTSSHSEISVTYIRVRTKSSMEAPACSNAA